MKKRLCSFLLALVMLVGLLPTSVFAVEPEKTVITEIVATYEFVQPTYGDQITKPEMVYTVEGDIPVILDSDGFDWYWHDGEQWNSVRTGHFVEGTWCHDVNVVLTDTENYTFPMEGATLIINDVEWCKTTGGWEQSPGFEIVYVPGEYPLTLTNPTWYAIYDNYVGKAITPFSFAKDTLGGTKPYTFSKTSGPDWLAVSEDGILTGTPTEVGSNDSLTVTVTDALGAQDSLEISVGETHMNPGERELVSRVVATVELPEIVCGFTLPGYDYYATVIEGAPVRISTNNSDLYPVDGEGNRGSSVDVVTGGNTYVMDIAVLIDGAAGHTHVLDEDNLEVIINGEETTYDSVYVNDDSSNVWVYTAPFTVEHAFDNDTDATCNGCDLTREGCDHQYDDQCDGICNLCDATREAPHEYSGICDTDCDLCDEERTAPPHDFTDCYDDLCEGCGLTRPYPTHTGDDCEDDTCNLCGETRHVPAHTYRNFADTTCDICGETRTINTAVLNEKMYAQITYGGETVDYIFTPAFTGEFVFTSHHSDSTFDTRGYILDAKGNVLWEDDDDGENHQFRIQETLTAGETYILRVKYHNSSLTGQLPFSISCAHDYEDECDDSCGVCGFTREAPHLYDNAADVECNNGCGQTREQNIIKAGETKSVTITDEVKYVDFVFIPERSGAYVFAAHGTEDQDTFGYIYDTDGTQLAEDDGSGGEDQFKISYEMEAGTVYILRAAFYSPADYGTFPISVACDHVYDDDCDEVCNLCDDTRQAPHGYTAPCDDECDACGQTRVPDDHTYINCEDGDCEYCGYEREPVLCAWDDCFDGECNVCGYTRPSPTHTYSDLLDTVCNLCEASRTLNYITVGETKEYDLEAGEYVDYVFECTVSGRYLFRSHGSSDKDAYGYIYHSGGGLRGEDDDSMGDRQFGMEYDFVAGETYVLRARFYSGNLSSTICVSLSCVEHIYDNDADAQCNACGETREAAAYTVNGTVSGAEEDAEVSVSLYAQGASEPAYNTTVIGNGSYSIAHVLPGSYTVKAVSEGCEDYTAAVTVADSNVTHDIAMTRKASAVTVNGVGDIDYTVSGNVIIVDHDVACKVGYLDGTTYKAITAVAKGDGTYTFTAPAGVTQVLLVVKGDATGDGAISLADSTRTKATYNKKTTLSAEALFAADASNDGSVTLADSTRIKAAYNKKTTLAW